MPGIQEGVGGTQRVLDCNCGFNHLVALLSEAISGGNMNFLPNLATWAFNCQDDIWLGFHFASAESVLAGVTASSSALRLPLRPSALGVSAPQLLEIFDTVPSASSMEMQAPIELAQRKAR